MENLGYPQLPCNDDECGFVVYFDWALTALRIIKPQEWFTDENWLYNPVEPYSGNVCSRLKGGNDGKPD
jgi:hypothetical protein